MHRRILGPTVVASLLLLAVAPLACSSGSNDVPGIVTQPPVNATDGAFFGDTGVLPDASPGIDSSTADAAPIDRECKNGVLDTNETDIDCGGPKCPSCADGKRCVAATDCLGKFCELNTNKCSSPSCTDTIRNGAETDVDCGGNCLVGCGVGRGCKVDKDCATGKCDLASGACACPTRMVTVSKATGGAYCIDETEVTNGDYDRFVRANVPATGTGSTQPAACAGNTTYVPNSHWPPPQPLSGSFGLPVRNVDWCDAVAYCKWAGKVLCGDMTGQPSTEPGNYQKDAWLNACSAQGANVYPYGNAHSPSACYYSGGVGPDSDWSDLGVFVNIPIPVIPSPIRACQGGVVGLFQMSGNVAEWQNSCDGSLPTSSCNVRGGSYASGNAAAQTCLAVRPESRLAAMDDVGIRCCQF